MEHANITKIKAIQDQANLAVQEYLSNLSDLSCSPAERIKSEQIALDSLTYLVDRHTKTYKKRMDYQDLRQDAWAILVQSMHTFDYNKCSDFTYWASLALKNLSRPAVKEYKRNKTIVLDESVSLLERDPSLSAYQLAAAKEALEGIRNQSADDWNLLSSFLYDGNLSEVNRELGDSFSRYDLTIKLRRIAKQLGCHDF